MTTAPPTGTRGLGLGVMAAATVLAVMVLAGAAHRAGRALQYAARAGGERQEELARLLSAMALEPGRPAGERPAWGSLPVAPGYRSRWQRRGDLDRVLWFWPEEAGVTGDRVLAVDAQGVLHRWMIVDPERAPEGERSPARFSGGPLQPGPGLGPAEEVGGDPPLPR